MGYRPGVPETAQNCSRHSDRCQLCVPYLSASILPAVLFHIKGKCNSLQEQCKVLLYGPQWKGCLPDSIGWCISLFGKGLYQFDFLMQQDSFSAFSTSCRDIDFTGSRNPLTWKQFVTGADMPYFTMMNYLIMNVPSLRITDEGLNFTFTLVINNQLLV